MNQTDCKLTANRREMTRRRFVAAFVGLLGFGAVYDQLVAECHRRGYDDGYTSLLVVGGVGVTLAAAAPVIGRRNAERVFWLFVASGVPMIVGDIGRYVKRRKGHWEWVNGNGEGRNVIQTKGMAGGWRAFSEKRPRGFRQG